MSASAGAGASSGASATASGADGVASGTEALELASGNTGNSLTLERVSEGHSSNDGLAAELLGGVVDDHAALAVAGEDELGAGALLEPRVGLVCHGDAAGAGTGGFGHDSAHIGGVGDTLDSDLVRTERGLRVGLEAGADDGSEGAHFSGAAGKEEGEGLAARRLADLDRVGRSKSSEESGGDGGGLHFDGIGGVWCGIEANVLSKERDCLKSK